MVRLLKVKLVTLIAVVVPLLVKAPVLKVVLVEVNVPLIVIVPLPPAFMVAVKEQPAARVKLLVVDLIMVTELIPVLALKSPVQLKVVC